MTLPLKSPLLGEDRARRERPAPAVEERGNLGLQRLFGELGGDDGGSRLAERRRNLQAKTATCGTKLAQAVRQRFTAAAIEAAP